jgi:small-conductance mechanosensitive channel
MMGIRNRDADLALSRIWFEGIVTGLIAVGAIVAKIDVERIHGWTYHSGLVTWLALVVFLLTAIYAVGRISDGLALLIAHRSSTANGAVARLLTTGTGYVVILFSVFGLLGGSLPHLLLGFGIAGVVLGIAAQQSLGNIFASLVLLFARPFIVGDYIRIRSGSIGVVDARVLGIGLTYVTVRTDDGLLKVPNSIMLASGIGQLNTSSTPPTSTERYVRSQGQGQGQGEGQGQGHADGEPLGD